MMLEQDVANITASIVAKSGIEALKISGKLLKELLRLLLDKVKENEKNKAGLISLKKLIKSNEEIQVLRIKKEDMQEFMKRAEGHRISYSALTHNEDATDKIFIKASQVELVKSVMEDIILKNAAKENENSIEKLLEKFDFKEIGEEENIYRHEVKDISLEKAELIYKNLKLENIKTDVSITECSSEYDKDPSELIASLEFKVAVPEKDKIVGIIEEMKVKSIEELKKLSEQLRVVNENEKGLKRYGVKLETEEKNNGFRDIVSYKMTAPNGNEIKHNLQESKYLKIADALKEIGFNGEQIKELKTEDKFISERVEKEKLYESLPEKKSLDKVISNAKIKANESKDNDQSKRKSKVNTKTKPNRQER